MFKMHQQYMSRIKGKFKRPALFSFQAVSQKYSCGTGGENYLSSHLTELITLMRRNMMIHKHKILTHDVKLPSMKKYSQVDEN